MSVVALCLLVALGGFLVGAALIFLYVWLTFLDMHL